MTDQTGRTSVVNRLMPYAEKPPSTDTRGTGTCYSWRLNIPARTYAIPTTQNIPSNLKVVGGRADGTIRPPLIDPKHAPDGISTREDVERELRNILGDVEARDIIIADSSGGDWLRPHVKIVGTVEEYVTAAKRIHDRYREVFEGDE